MCKNFGGIFLKIFFSFLAIWLLYLFNSGLPRNNANLKATNIEPSPDTGLTEASRSITFDSIPAGSFQMGSSIGYGDERPVHTVSLSAFRISATEITNEQYAAYLNAALTSEKITTTSTSVIGSMDPYSGKVHLDLSGGFDSNNRCWITYDGSEFKVVEGWERYPVVYVTWYGAYEFAAHYGFRLPTEAEWEYAARGGDQEEYGTDNGTIDHANANYNENVGHPTQVGDYPSNLFGLYDMAGNVWEWCNDWYEYKYYLDSPEDNPTGPRSGSLRVLRGGSWHSSKHHCRSAFRYKHVPDFSRSDIGFRVVR